MATPTIPNGEEYFFPIIYEGNGGGQRVGKFVPFTDNGTIANSVIFNDDDNAYLSRTNDAGDRDTFTISVWVKRGNLGSVQHIFDTYDGSSSNDGYIRFNANNTISIRLGSPSNMLYTTNRTFEDTSKWYHIMLSVNTNDSTAGDRAKLYIDGDRITSFSTQTNAGSADDTQFNYSSATFRIGSTTGGSYDFDGYLAEFNQVDGTALTPSTFGVTDTSTGRWIPKTLSGITYGTNGFRLQFLDSTHAGIDTSGNGNTFTASGLIDIESQPIAMGGTAFDTGSAGAWDGSYPVANGFTKNTSTQAIYNDGSTAIGGVIGWDFGSGRSANIQHIKINQIAVNNSITGFAFEYSDNGSDYTSVGTFSVTASASEQTVSVTNTAGKHRYWRLRATTDTSGGQSSYRWIVAFLGFYSEPITTDSPTQNFATFDPLDSGNNAGATPGTAVLANGNLRITAPSNPSNWDQYRTSKPLISGKFYCEVTLTSLNTATYFGVISRNQNIKGGGWYSDQSTGWSYASNNGNTENNNVDLSYGGARSEGDVVGIAVDLVNGKLWFSENGTYPNSGNPATGANPAYLNLRRATQDGGLCFTEARGYSGHNDWNFGQRAFKYTPPTDFVAVQQDNMSTTDKGITGMAWIKNRDATTNHSLQDSSRGSHEMIYPDLNTQEITVIDGVQKFLKGGCSIEDDTLINTNVNSYVNWNWVANGGTTASNSDGSITSTVQANTTAGFSIVQFTGTGANATVGHGLSSAPEWIVSKNLATSASWAVYHKNMTSAAYTLFLDTTAALTSSSTMWNSTAPTSSVINVGANFQSNGSSQDMVHFCWHSVDGFSKFGLYEGNNSTDGTFVYLGFKPAFVMVKSIDGSSSSYPWSIYDSARSPTNPVSLLLEANSTAVDNTLDRIDFLSNGFKFRQAYSYSNAGETYVYVAFAEHPFVGDGTSPVTAR